jgi:hypothetical protein
MRLSAENLVLLVAARKGYVCSENQPFYRTKSGFNRMIRDLAIAALVRPVRGSPGRWELTNRGELGAAFFSMLPACPKELFIGDFKWRLLRK